MLGTARLDLFAGIPVANYAAALTWYEQLRRFFKPKRLSFSTIWRSPSRSATSGLKPSTCSARRTSATKRETLRFRPPGRCGARCVQQRLPLHRPNWLMEVSCPLPTLSVTRLRPGNCAAADSARTTSST